MGIWWAAQLSAIRYQEKTNTRSFGAGSAPQDDKRKSILRASVVDRNLARDSRPALATELRCHHGLRLPAAACRSRDVRDGQKREQDQRHDLIKEGVSGEMMRDVR